MSEDRHGPGAAVFRTPDGALVVEIRLESWHLAGLQQLISDARAAGADALWAYGFLVDSALGFEPRGGYALLTAPALPPSTRLASPPTSAVRGIQLGCFSGVWGHHEPNEPDPSAEYVGLYEHGRWVGICELDSDNGWIYGPGVLPELRTSERYAELVRGAAARTSTAQLTLETWGDTDETVAAYQSLGFDLIERLPGWELPLGKH